MLAWNVYISDWNSKNIEVHNVFDHGYFLEDCKKYARKYKNDREKFLEEVRKSLMYWYWSKCEWEVIVSHWPPNERFNDAKVDVYEQVNLNWGIFCDYIWAHVGELTKRPRKKKENTNDLT